MKFFIFRYYRANSVRYETGICKPECHLNHYCAITRVDYNEFRKCFQPDRNIRNSSATATLAICPLALLICSSFVNIMGKLLRSFYGNKSKSTCKLKQQQPTTEFQGKSSTKIPSLITLVCCGCSWSRRRPREKGVVLSYNSLCSLSKVLGNYIIKFQKFPYKFSTDGTVSSRFQIIFNSIYVIFLHNVKEYFRIFLGKRNNCQTSSLLVSLISYCFYTIFYKSLLNVFILLPLLVLLLLKLVIAFKVNKLASSMAYIVNVFS